MKKRALTALLLCLVCIFALSGTAMAAGSVGEVTAINPSAQAFAMDQVAEFIASGDETVSWDASTRIFACTELYSPSGFINGYIFKFETQGMPTGYMQIGVLDEQYFVVNLGFEGDDYLTKMVDHYILSIDSAMLSDFEHLLGSNTSTSVSNELPRVYYTGNFNYYICDAKNNLINLSTGKIQENGFEELELEYKTYEYHAENNLVENTDNEGRTDIDKPFFFREQDIDIGDADSVDSIGGKNGKLLSLSALDNYTVFRYYDANSYMKTMSYYSGYTNHCSPTAATNLIMYWKYGRDYFSSNSASQTTVFEWFYTQMGTTSTGTYTDPEHLYLPYLTYISLYSGAGFPNGEYIPSSEISFSVIKTIVGNSNPLSLGILEYGGGNHAVNVWGFYINSSSNYLRITDNWGSSISLSLINYNAYTYDQIIYIDLAG